MAKVIITIGLFLIVIGAVLYVAPGVFNWFGKLPGDIRLESRRINLFFPITSMLIISIVLTIIINLFKR